MSMMHMTFNEKQSELTSKEGKISFRNCSNEKYFVTVFQRKDRGLDFMGLRSRMVENLDVNDAYDI